jgi:FkbM family methyltransferase
VSGPVTSASPVSGFDAVEVAADGPSHWTVARAGEPPLPIVDDYLRSLGAGRARVRFQYAQNLACLLNWSRGQGLAPLDATADLSSFADDLRAGGDWPSAHWRPATPERAAQVIGTARGFLAYLIERGVVAPSASARLREAYDIYDAGVQSFAQNGEDLAIASYLGRRAATYIDVGCLWPIQHSSTYFFYRLGGFGLCIDPNPAAAERFPAQRPRDIFLPAAVGAAAGTTVYHRYANAVHNTSSSFRAAHHEHRLRTAGDEGRRLVESIVIPVVTLDDAIAQSGLLERCDGRVDLLSIDVAGAESEVLAGLTLHVVRPRLIVVEHVRRGDERHCPPHELRVLAPLLADGYELVGFYGVSCYLLDAGG